MLYSLHLSYMYVAWVAGSLNRRYGPSAQQLPKAWSDISAVCVSIFDWLVSYALSDWIILAKAITQLSRNANNNYVRVSHEHLYICTLLNVKSTSSWK